jgi:uncharacterized protein YecE (DUF72 family)
MASPNGFDGRFYLLPAPWLGGTISGYDNKALDTWAARVAAPKRGTRDVFVYFDNDAKVRAPFDAQGLCMRIDRLVRNTPKS